MGNSPSVTTSKSGTFTPSITMSNSASVSASAFQQQQQPIGRGIKFVTSDGDGDGFQLDAATLTSDNVALVWTQPRAFATSTDRSQISGAILKPVLDSKDVTQKQGGPLNPNTDEEYVSIARVGENQFVAAWEDQVKSTATGKRIDKVLVQVFSGATGESTSSTFQWDANQEQTKPDITYVSATQVIVAYQVASGVKFIRLRIKPDGSLAQVGASVALGVGVRPKVQKTVSGGFLITYKDGGDSFLEIYDSTNAKLVGPVKIGGSDAVAYLSNGKIVTVWEMNDKLYYRLYRSSDGGISTARMEVNSLSGRIQTSPAIVSMSTTGGFMITWQQKDAGSSDYDIMASEFTSDGSMLYGNAFGVHSEKTAGDQTRPTLAEIGNGAMLFAWNHQNLPSAVTTRVNYQIFDLPSTR